MGCGNAGVREHGCVGTRAHWRAGVRVHGRAGTWVVVVVCACVCVGGGVVGEVGGIQYPSKIARLDIIIFIRQFHE